MYDMHSHILPNVDDGPNDIQESIEMAKIAEANGIRTIIATPHYIEGVMSKKYLDNQELVSKLNRVLKKRGIGVKILLGNEVAITPNLLALLDENKITTINKSRYILVELPRFDMPIFIEDLFFRLKLRRIVPIIAHPERNKNIIENPNILYELILRGSIAQINSLSIIGYYGEEVKKTAEKLLSHNMIHVLGTDAHSSEDIRKSLKSFKSKFSRFIGDEKIDSLVFHNPKTIVQNKPFEIIQPQKYRPKVFFSFNTSFFKLKKNRK